MSGSATKERILVVDSKDAVLRTARELLDGELEVDTASDGTDALARLRASDYDAVLADVRLRGPDGQSLWSSLRQLDVDVVLTAQPGTAEVAAASVVEGAYAWVEKPFPPGLLDLMKRAARHRRARREAAQVRRAVESRFGMGSMVGTSGAMRPVFDAITRAGADDAPLVLVGERGTGKELAARLVHQRSPRAHRLFARICATRYRPDRLRDVLDGQGDVVEGGTLYVEELAELPGEPDQVLPAPGEPRPHRIAVAACEPAAAERLAQALGGAHLVELPALRERLDDVPLLAAHFIAKHAPRIAPAVERIEPGAVDALLAHDWPGNVRELEAVIERALVSSRRDTIERYDIAPQILAAPPLQPPIDPASVSFREALSLARERTSQQYIAALLRLCDGNVTRAAELAGLERESLHRLMRRYDIRSEYFKPPTKEEP
jgi:DNA-binding NtrC family response regulator